jgi:hypothetical protein
MDWLFTEQARRLRYNSNPRPPSDYAEPAGSGRYAKRTAGISPALSQSYFYKNILASWHSVLMAGSAYFFVSFIPAFKIE